MRWQLTTNTSFGILSRRALSLSPQLKAKASAAPHFILQNHHVDKKSEELTRFDTRSDYKQLPDDSQFIEQHYEELKYWRERLHVSKFQEFSKPSILLAKLMELRPPPMEADKEADTLQNYLDSYNLQEGMGKGIVLVKDDTKINTPLARFNRFFTNLKITLNMNGGHLFALDLLIQNRDCFELFEKSRKREN